MLKEISIEHQSLFPMADLQSQEEKMTEELKEVMQELVDVMIVCAGIYRFNKQKALEIRDNVITVCKILGIDLKDIESEVNRKWQVNLKRKWVWNGKTYHHVGDDE